MVLGLKDSTNQLVCATQVASTNLDHLSVCCLQNPYAYMVLLPENLMHWGKVRI